MMSRLFRTATRRLILTAMLCAVGFVGIDLCPTASGQMTGKMAGKPIGVGYMKNLTEASAFNYMKKLTSRMNFDSSLFETAPSDEDIKKMVPQVDEQITGQAWYMVQGMIPSFDLIFFRKVADVADAKRMLNARGKSQGGSNMESKVEDEGEDRYRFVRSWSNEFSAPNQSAQEYVDQQNENQADMVSGSRSRTSYSVVETDGKQMVKQTTSWEERYRFYDNMLFSGSRDDLFEMELPSSKELVRGVQGGKDMGVDAYFDRIPAGIKTLGWNMLNSTAGTMMQQQDDEETTQANVRSTSIQLGLDVVKALMFDVQEAHGWLRFANEEDQSIRGQLLFETRRNAELEEQLETASSGISRFAPILRDEAVATIHTCITLPEASPMFQAVAAWLPGYVEQELTSDATAVLAASKLALTLSDLADTPTLELCMKAGWSEASDGVFYGGLRIGSNEGLIQAVVTLLQSTDPPDGLMELSEIDGLSVLHFKIPQNEQRQIAEASGLQLSDIYVTQGASCLWFAIGNENALQMVKSCIARCESGGAAGRAPLVTAEVDGEAWLALPQDDPVGITSLLMYLDGNVEEFPPSPMMFNFGNGGKPTPLLQRCIDLGGNHRASMQVVSDRSGLKIDVELGEVIGNYLLVRQLDTQNRAMQSSREQVQEAQEASSPKAAKSSGN
ncbi:MAG: hypothetical protein ABJZ55_23480 [Fuerstiella sp.]